MAKDLSGKNLTQMRKWIYKNQEGSLKDAALFISRELKMGSMAATVCANRGLTTVDKVQTFLNPRLDQLTSPFKILDLEKAVKQILLIQSRGETMRIFTDYDVDGTTGAALLTWFFRAVGFKFDVTQPDRFKDGYGLNVKAIEQAHEDGIKTLITVDCGITNFDAAEKAKELGVDLIIVDHHQIDPVRGIPSAFAVIDPQRADDPSELKQLCGCALAFYLCIAIRSQLREKNFFVEKKIAEPNMKNLLDLVVIATAADMVPLTGDNRILVKHGLDVLRNTTKPGLRSLMDQAGVEVKTVSPSNLGFVLGPRINASGRMGSAETAYRVLTTEDPEEGRRLATELESVNKTRAEIQNQIWDQVREKVNQGLEKGKYSHAVVVASEDWHEGVVGIVASKVTEHFKKPAIILAIREDGIAKGSVRSFGGYNVLEALHLSKQLLLGYGGHKYAAGLSLPKDAVDGFADHFNQMIASLSPSHDGNELHIEGSCKSADLTIKAIEEMEKLAPFGPGNPEPVFAIQARVDTQAVLKGRHLKIKFVPEAGLTPLSKTKSLEGIWFSAAERIEYTEFVEESARTKKPCLFAGIPELNRFMGKVTPTLRIKDASQI